MYHKIILQVIYCSVYLAKSVKQKKTKQTKNNFRMYSTIFVDTNREDGTQNHKVRVLKLNLLKLQIAVSV